MARQDSKLRSPLLSSSLRRPGVPISTSAPCASASRCVFMGLPPVAATDLKGMVCAIALASPRIWTHNSAQTHVKLNNSLLDHLKVCWGPGKDPSDWALFKRIGLLFQSFQALA